jgi:4-hydroxythreonine-4-phosphate dehydrogenase
MRLAITLGDPRGIGAEIVAKAMEDPGLSSLVRSGDLRFVVIGPRDAGVPVQEDVGLWRPTGDEASDMASAGSLAGRAIERAVHIVQSGAADGIVTAPIDKAALHAGGFDFPGHTEMLASLTGCDTAMMLASERLRVVLATTHIALRDVPAAVTVHAIVRAAEITRHGLEQGFGISTPRLALCALNPHAGDHGRFGDEDDTVLAPAARACGIAGPFPADTVFVRAMRGEFDAVIAPYHDVGMTAIKVASFGSAVNITLGLPFPRTSPDHGTAIGIAGKNMADASSMVRAILVCMEMVQRPT